MIRNDLVRVAMVTVALAAIALAPDDKMVLVAGLPVEIAKERALAVCIFVPFGGNLRHAWAWKKNFINRVAHYCIRAIVWFL